MGLNMNLDDIEKDCVAYLSEDLQLDDETITNLKAVSHLTHTDLDRLVKDYIMEGIKGDLDNNGITKRREYLKERTASASE